MPQPLPPLPRLAAALACVVAACATPPPAPPPAATEAGPPRPPPFPIAPHLVEPADPPEVTSSPPVVIANATVMTAAGKTFSPGFLLLKDGRIARVGEGAAPQVPGATVVDGTGMFATPGLIDTHSHMGVYPLPGTNGNSDGNEASSPTTAQVWAEHGFWPQDPALPRALAGGITTIQVLPGSANLIGGRSFTAKLHLDRQHDDGSARAMRFPGAPQGLKMACGENPKRVYGERGGFPSTRMGNIAGFKKAFADAAEYRRRWQKYDRDLQLWLDKQDKKKKDPKLDATKPGDLPGPDDPPEPPSRDLALDTLRDVLDGKILVHNHCYRADEMNIMLDLAHQYRFKIRSFHHGLEAYKLRWRLAEEGVAVSTWADWWGFKMESYDGVPHNAALLTEAGARAIIHSDSESEIRHLNQEAAKAQAAGKQLGIAITDDQALRWVTANPAWALGVDEQTGTLTEGKMADVVLWNKNPLSVYALPQKVWIDGVLSYDRGVLEPSTDFALGTGIVPPGARAQEVQR